MEKRADDYMRRSERLWELAEKDQVYHAWEADYKQYKEKVKKIGKFLPKSWRNILRGCMDCRAMMLQRVISLGCMCMEFTGEEPIWYEEVNKERIIKVVPETKQ